jgi:hypothetical protein
MKRGPNKGYIKNLADRVNVLEAGARQSIDGDIFGTGLSGDDNSYARRNYSLPAPGRTSFSGLEFRDRLDSFGAFPSSVTSQPRRNRFSIAIPPDQELPGGNEDAYDDIDERPTKRLKMDEDKQQLGAIAIDASDLAKYYELIHPQFPILPDANAKAIKIVSKASPVLQHALIATISLLPNTAAIQENGSTQKSSIKTQHEMADRLHEAYADLKSTADTLVFIWTSTLLVFHHEFAMDIYNHGPLASVPLVGMYVELLPALRHSEAPNSAVTIEKAVALDIDFKDLEEAAARTFCLAALQSKLSYLAVGKYSLTSDDIGLFVKEEMPYTTNFPPSASFLAYNTKTIASTGSLMLSRFEDPNMYRLFTSTMSDTIDNAALRSTLTENSPLFQQLEEFIKLVLARITMFGGHLSCFFPAAKLAEMLKTASSTYSPLDSHLYTVTALTFLEVLSVHNSGDEWARPLAITGLNSMRPVLQQKAAEYAASRSNADKKFWGMYKGKEIPRKSWAETLSDHVDACETINWINAGVAARHRTESGQEDVTLNFASLVARGYFNVLSYFARGLVGSELEEREAAAHGVEEGGVTAAASAAGQ